MKRTVWLWTLVFVFVACEDIVEEPDISNQQVEILAPTNGTVVTDSLIQFSWGGIVDSDGYVLQVARPNFEEAAQFVVDTTMIIDSTFVGTRLRTKLSNDAYEWRVKAFNSGFETEYSSSEFQVNR